MPLHTQEVESTWVGWGLCYSSGEVLHNLLRRQVMNDSRSSIYA